ncbi:MAG: hypothetical protein AAGA53_10590 [Pseudomonadota bacterium]
MFKRLCLIATLSLLPFDYASGRQLAEPALNACSAATGISKCEVKCVRELGEQCLVTHVNFEGKNLKSGTDLFRAKFLTCVKADVDLQIKSLAMEFEDLGEEKGSGILSALASSSAGSITTKDENAVIIKPGETEARLARLPFTEFLNSGESHIEVTANLKQCGTAENPNSCSINGKLVAVTNPNIRCDFHDTTKSGAFRPATLQTSPSLTNSQQPVGRIGQ